MGLNTNTGVNNYSPLGNGQMPGYNHHFPPQYYHPTIYQPQHRYSPYQQSMNPPNLYPTGQPMIGKPHINTIFPNGMLHPGMMGMYNGPLSSIQLNQTE